MWERGRRHQGLKEGVAQHQSGSSRGDLIHRPDGPHRGNTEYLGGDNASNNGSPNHVGCTHDNDRRAHVSALNVCCAAGNSTGGDHGGTHNWRGAGIR